MTRLSAFVYCFLGILALVGIYRGCSTIDNAMKVMHESCLIGDGSPSYSLNDPNRKPFSYRK